MLEAGALAPLRQTVAGAAKHTSEQQQEQAEEAAKVMVNLALVDDMDDTFVRAEIVRPLLAVLASGQPQLRTLACMALENLCMQSPAIRDHIGSAGGVPAAVQLLGQADQQLAARGASLLGRLALSNANRKLYASQADHARAVQRAQASARHAELVSSLQLASRLMAIPSDDQPPPPAADEPSSRPLPSPAHKSPKRVPYEASALPTPAHAASTSSPQKRPPSLRQQPQPPQAHSPQLISPPLSPTLSRPERQQPHDAQDSSAPAPAFVVPRKTLPKPPTRGAAAAPSPVVVSVTPSAPPRPATTATAAAATSANETEEDRALRLEQYSIGDERPEVKATHQSRFRSSLDAIRKLDSPAQVLQLLGLSRTAPIPSQPSHSVEITRAPSVGGAGTGGSSPALVPSAALPPRPKTSDFASSAPVAAACTSPTHAPINNNSNGATSSTSLPPRPKTSDFASNAAAAAPSPIINNNSGATNSTALPPRPSAVAEKRQSIGGAAADALSPEEAKARQHQARTRVAQELLETEGSYCRNLSIIVKKFYTPLVQISQSRKPFIRCAHACVLCVL